MPYFLVWHSRATGVVHQCVWHSYACAHTGLCGMDTGAPHQFHETGVLVCNRCGTGVFLRKQSNVTIKGHGICWLYAIRTWLIYSLSAQLWHTYCICAHQLHSCDTPVIDTCVAVTQVLLSGVAKVCPHTCGTPVAQLWHTSGTFTCVYVYTYIVCIFLLYRPNNSLHLLVIIYPAVMSVAL